MTLQKRNKVIEFRQHLKFKFSEKFINFKLRENLQNSIFKEHFRNSNLCIFIDWNKIRIDKSFPVFMSTHLIFYGKYKNSAHILIYDVLAQRILLSFYNII